jgi:DnaD/phage-associated family protein
LKGFSGFRADEDEIALPASFFSELAPAIGDLTELKLTLLLLRRNAEAERTPLFTLEELSAQPGLLAAITPASGSAGVAALRAALERAAARGVLLRVIRTRGDERREWYVINDPGGQQLAADIEAGKVDDEALEMEPAAWRVERPNIFVLYEQNVGLLQPLIVDELREAEKLYPANWIEDAFRLAVERNIRNWRYVRGILQRWARDGKQDLTVGDDDEASGGRRRYTEGHYGHLIRR